MSGSPVGRHTRPQDQELGQFLTTFTGDEPSIFVLRNVVRHFDHSMKALGLDPQSYEKTAELTVSPRYQSTYRMVGWRMEAGPRG